MVTRGLVSFGDDLDSGLYFCDICVRLPLLALGEDSREDRQRKSCLEPSGYRVDQQFSASFYSENPLQEV